MGGETSTVTIVFTDVVGSTERRSRLGDAVANRLDAEHEQLVAEVIDTAGGRVVKGLGDGVMAVFASAADAVTAAIATQRAVAASNRRLANEQRTAIRVGLSLGDTTFDGKDYRGMPVVEAARLCAAAGTGRILCSEVVRLLARSSVGDVFGEPIAMELKGIAESVTAYELLWQDDSESNLVPTALVSHQRFPFVGRTGELEVLDRAWKRALVGERPVVLLGGEPGLGKTRLSAEFAERVARSDGVVFAGRCEEGLDVPFQPFVEALRGYASNDTARLDLGADAGELVRLWPGLATRVPGLPEPVRADAETERYRLLDAVAGWLSAASTACPLLLVLDDLHWATEPTLLLLRHVVRSTHPMRLMVLVTYRDTEAAGAVADIFADLRRDGAERISLNGLDREGVGALMQSAAQHPLDDRAQTLADALHLETRGNPFFIGEVLTHLAETGAIYQQDGRWTSDLDASDIPIPESVRDVVSRRLGRLSSETNAALQIAAVVGREFDLAVVGHATGNADAAITAFEEAIGAGLVEELGVGQYRFAHALVRDALYDAVPATRRAQMHRSIGGAIEAVHAHAIDDVLGDLARHFAAAVVPGDAKLAIGYAIRAGKGAADRRGFDEAALQFGRALELADAVPGTVNDEERCDLLLRLGEALRWTGHAGANDVERRACQAAIEIGQADLLTRAALQNPALDSYTIVGEVNQERIALFEAAIAAIGTEDSTDRALLLATLATEFAFSPADRRRREQLSDEAVAMARRLGDDEVLMQVVMRRFAAYWQPEGLAERGRCLDEARAIEPRIVGGAMARVADEYSTIYAFEAGDIDGAEASVRRAAAKLERFDFVYGSYAVIEARARLAQIAGRLDEAEQLITETFEAASTVREDAFNNYSISLFLLRYEQGRLDELTDLLVSFAADVPNLVALRATLPFTLLRAGRHDEAKPIYDEFAGTGFDLPLDPGWGAAASILARACALLADADGARLLYERMAPFADQAIATGLYYLGSMRHYLGELAATFGDLDRARDEYTRAEVWEQRMRAPIWTANAQAGQAEVLARMGDKDAARELATGAFTAATAHGGGEVAARGQAVLDAL